MMKLLVAASVIGVWAAGIAHGQGSGAPRRIVEIRRVVFPAYDSYRGISRYASRDAYASATGDAEFVMDRLTYRSDGLQVFAYLYRPSVPPAGRTLPVVVFNRGSYVRADFSPEVLMPASRLARAGYLVVAPALRESGGAPGHDEMGGADLRDIFNIVPALEEIPYADASRIFLYGESRGGIMSLMAARQGFPARAMAVFGAITDFAPFIAPGTAGRALAPTIWPGFPANESAIVEARSAVRWADQINVPVLLMNGGADRDVSPSNAITLADALQKLGKRYELKIFYGEEHVLGGRAAERDADAIAWFRRWQA
jgi:dipeptidyl aminopeptidase/acylaminoacyl peptidase